MKILHVIDSVELEASGPSYSVPRVCRALSERGDEIVLLSLSKSPTTTDINFRHKTFRPDFASIPVLKRIRASRGLSDELLACTRQDTLIHSHGIWLMPNVYPARAAKRAGAPLVVSPRGMLGKAALRFSATAKKLFWLYAQRRALDRVDCFHATSEQELEDIRSIGLKQPVAIIPNGIDVEVLEDREPREKAVLYLGRIHPKKGLDTLVRAWAAVERSFPEWELRIAGPVDSRYANELVAKSQITGATRIKFLGARFGRAKDHEYARASLFVLPTLNENFGMVVAEALSKATPVLCSEGAPWSRLREERAGWWVGLSEKEWSSALIEAISTSPEELRAMGHRGQQWMLREFGWPAIASDFSTLYEWLLYHRQSRPSFVFT
jgi:glycosyltransferase involved in cell wall biosynthesis